MGYMFIITPTLFIWLKEGEVKCSKENKKCLSENRDKEEEEEEDEEPHHKYERNKNKSKRLTFRRKSKKGLQLCSFSHELFENCSIIVYLSLSSIRRGFHADNFRPFFDLCK